MTQVLEKTTHIGRFRYQEDSFCCLIFSAQMVLLLGAKYVTALLVPRQMPRREARGYIVFSSHLHGSPLWCVALGFLTGPPLA